MLGDWQSLECAIKSSSSLSHERLLEHERKIYFPYPGRFIKKDKRSLEKRIHLLVFSPVLGRIATTEVVHPEFEVLPKSACLGLVFRWTRRRKKEVPFSTACKISGVVCKRVP